MTDARHRAGQAKQELPITDEAFALVRSAMVEMLTGLTPTNTSAMQALVCGIQALDAVQKAVQGVIDGGSIEDAAEELKPLLGVA